MYMHRNWYLTLLQFLNVFEYVKFVSQNFVTEVCNIHGMLISCIFIFTDISGFELNTEQRSHKRENFEMHKKAREAEIEAAKRQRERQKEEEEKAYVAKVRAEAVHKSLLHMPYKWAEAFIVTYHSLIYHNLAHQCQPPITK